MGNFLNFHIIKFQTINPLAKKTLKPWSNMLFDILPSKVPFSRNEAKHEISSCIILSYYPTQTIACFFFLGGGRGLSWSSSQVFLVQNYFSILFFWISISNSDGVICEALLWTVCPLLTVRNKKGSVQCRVKDLL